MEMNSANVEAVVKQVLESMLDKKIPASSTQPAESQAVPKTAHVAMLTSRSSRFRKWETEISL